MYQHFRMNCTLTKLVGEKCTIFIAHISKKKGMNELIS